MTEKQRFPRASGSRTAEGRHLTSFTLDEMERRLDPDHFARTHRSCLVNLRYVRELIPWFSDTY